MPVLAPSCVTTVQLATENVHTPPQTLRPISPQSTPSIPQANPHSTATTGKFRQFWSFITGAIQSVFFYICLLTTYCFWDSPMLLLLTALPSHPTMDMWVVSSLATIIELLYQSLACLSAGLCSDFSLLYTWAGWVTVEVLEHEVGLTILDTDVLSSKIQFLFAMTSNVGRF